MFKHENNVALKFFRLLIVFLDNQDRDIIALLDKGKQKEAIELKEQTITKLQAALPFDSNNYLPKVIARAETLLTSMKSKKEKAAVRKMVDYEAKCEEECDDWGYVCYSDSDEEVHEVVDKVDFAISGASVSYFDDEDECMW